MNVLVPVPVLPMNRSTTVVEMSRLTVRLVVSLWKSKAWSREPGTVAPPAPPEVELQLPVLFQTPLVTELTQNRLAPRVAAGMAAQTAAAIDTATRLPVPLERNDIASS